MPLGGWIFLYRDLRVFSLCSPRLCFFNALAGAQLEPPSSVIPATSSFVLSTNSQHPGRRTNPFVALITYVRQWQEIWPSFENDT